jgi:lysozyme family protein
MSKFETAIPVIMKHEGGWVNDSVDPGGETNYGWSMLTIKRLGLHPNDLGLNQSEFTPGCLKLMSANTAITLYRKYFWNKYAFEAVMDQTSATKMFDAAVNMGPRRAIGFAQRACQIAVDGIMGQVTVAAINKMNGEDFVRAYAKQMTSYYESIIVRNPSLVKFKNNWMKRAQWGVVAVLVKVELVRIEEAAPVVLEPVQPIKPLEVKVKSKKS